MNERHESETRARLVAELCSELLILPDGRILVHNLTPAFAGLLSELNPGDEEIGARARQLTYHAK